MALVTMQHSGPISPAAERLMYAEQVYDRAHAETVAEGKNWRRCKREARKARLAWLRANPVSRFRR